MDDSERQSFELQTEYLLLQILQLAHQMKMAGDTRSVVEIAGELQKFIVD